MFTRRAALRGATAVAAMSAVPATAIIANDIDPLLSLEAQFRQADPDWGAAPEGSPAEEEAVARFKVLDDQMSDAVPVNLEGVAAKLRYLKWDAFISCNRRAEEAARTILERRGRIMGEARS